MSLFDTIEKIVTEQYDGSFCEYLYNNSDIIPDIDSYIDSCDDTVFEKAILVCYDYFGLNMPVDVIKKAFKHELLLAYENYLGCMSDTYVRDILADALMDVINVPRWPLNMDSDEYKTDFKEALIKQAKSYGITFVGGE